MCCGQTEYLEAAGDLPPLTSVDRDELMASLREHAHLNFEGVSGNNLCMTKLLSVLLTVCVLQFTQTLKKLVGVALLCQGMSDPGSLARACVLPRRT